MNALQSPGRAVAAVGAVVAVGAATMMAVLAGSASAAEPGRCVDNVNVRAEPSMDARIITVCESGTAVQVGESRNGFVRLVDLGGWSSAEFVSVNGAEPAAVSDPSSTADEQDDATSPGSGTDGTDATGDAGSTGDASDAGEQDGQSGRDADDATGGGADEYADEAEEGSEESGSAGGSPLDGLLG